MPGSYFIATLKENIRNYIKANKCLFSFPCGGKNMSKNIYRPPNLKFPQGYVRQCVCVLQ